MTKRIGLLTSGGDCRAQCGDPRRRVARCIFLRLGSPRHPQRLDGPAAPAARCRASRSGPPRCRDDAPWRHDPRNHQQGRPLCLPDAGRQSSRSLAGGHRRLPHGAARRIDRHRRGRQLRNPAASRAAGRPASGRDPEDDRQRCARYRGIGRLRHGRRGRDRSARPAAADSGEPRSGDGAQGDGPRCRPHRHCRGDRGGGPTSC
jgi:hypothetical protein